MTRATFAWSAEELRETGHRVVDMVVEHLTRLPGEPVFQPVPETMVQAFETDAAPNDGAPIDAVLDEFAARVEPWPFGNGHPRFYGWVNPPPHPLGVFAEMLAAAMNPSVAGGNHAAVHVERQVVRWFAELAGFPHTATGLLVSGGSTATLTAFAAARHRAAQRVGLDIRRDGMQPGVPPRPEIPPQTKEPRQAGGRPQAEQPRQAEQPPQPEEPPQVEIPPRTETPSEHDPSFTQRDRLPGVLELPRSAARATFDGRWPVMAAGFDRRRDGARQDDARRNSERRDEVRGGQEEQSGRDLQPGGQDVRSGREVRQGGVWIEPRFVVYLGTEGHGSARKAAELLGIGSANVRVVESDERYRMRVGALREAIEEDVKAGHVPVAVLASAGTVNTGAIDDIGAIADVCAEFGVWLHVDAAYGGPAVLLLDEHATTRTALGRADSIALDPHKWLYAPVDAGLVLVRDGALARDAFSLVPPYLRTDDDPAGVGGPVWFSEYGLEQTRPFRALKVWMLLKHLGVRGYRELISHDLAVAERLAEGVGAAADLELLARGLSVVCFRCRPAGGPHGESLDAVNRRVLAAVQLGGAAFLSGTTVDGMFALRACVVNPRATLEDADAVVAEVRARLADEWKP